MDSSSRKIELQTPEDFTFLIDNVRRAATDSINAAFPPVEGADGQEDELRVRIEQMVNDVRSLSISPTLHS
jgi:kinetochor protein Mis14/NSL1